MPIKKTSEINSKKYLQWRINFKSRILTALKKSKEPMTSGDLFLIVKNSTNMINSMLNEMEKEGLVTGVYVESYTRVYHGRKFRFSATVWSAKKSRK